MRSQEELKGFLRVAVRACRAAGRHQMKFFGQAQEVEHKGEIDLVTSVDRESEEKIVRILNRAYPGHGILAEEGAPSRAKGGYLWVVDPLDGTTNYSRGFPFFCVSIALAFRGRIIVGAVFNPLLDEIFTATRGGGAFLNGKRIQVSKQADLDGGFLATGFPYDIRRSKKNNLDHFARFATRCLAVRRAGSAALDLAGVACGRFDGFWELKLKPWDLAAGTLLVSEAGGRVTSPGGRAWSLKQADVVASNGAVHGQMLDVLRSH
jgi:myo-inositol-1(or 4)-monophosphatase